MKTPVYLDYASTTPVDPQVAQRMSECLTLDGIFANPASRSHRFGWQAEEAVDVARSQIADLVQCDPREIVFTSGATESDNLALIGAATANSEQGSHIITTSIEHKAVLDTCAHLETLGFTVTYLQPDAQGHITAKDVANALTKETLLVSVMHVNNEIGVIQDIASIGLLCQENGVLFHVDAAQSVGKLPIDLTALNVDLMSFCAHKCYGPKGIGALYVKRRPKVRVAAQIHGGGHERGMRSGTLPTHQIVGFGEACELAKQRLEDDAQRLRQYTNTLWRELNTLEGVVLNGDIEQRVPGILNVSFAEVDGESLVMGLHDIAISTGSACTSASMTPSYVLTALGRSEALAHAGLRFSVGRFTTAEEIEFAAKRVCDVVQKLRNAQVKRA